ncbi:(Fe-S)-binding protein, partial [Myxococcota bacterium]|nr:(Fe-S)-binding protein [Myxococcota bacterium]
MPGIVNAVLMAVLLVAAMTMFFITMAGRVRVMVAGLPDNRFDHPWRRFVNMMKIAFAQSRMFKEVGPGLMHAFIFWGFLILLFRSASLIGRAWAPEWSSWTLFWFSEGLDGWYTFLKDITELVVLVMIAWATWRRLVTRPKRLANSFSAFLILGFIAFLMLSDFIYDGARFAMLSIGGAVPEAARHAL